MALQILRASQPTHPAAQTKGGDIFTRPRGPTAELADGNGHIAAAAAFCAVSSGISLKRQKKKSPSSQTALRAKGGLVKSTMVAVDDSINNCAVEAFNNDDGGVLVLPNASTEANETKVGRDFMGIFIIGCAALPPLHVLPVFLDMKIAADDALPGLTETTLPISSTAIFLGWLASAAILDRALEIFNQKQMLVLHIVGLLLVTLAMITLPHLTAGNLVVFTSIRFLQGLLLNVTALQNVYLQQRAPPGQGNQVLVANSIMYSVFTILMAWLCSGPTLMMDWRLEASLLYLTPLALGLVVAFPEWWQIVRSLPVAFSKKVSNFKHDFTEEKTKVVIESGKDEVMTPAEWRNMVAMAVGFAACGCGFYGLNYSAGQLSSDIYMSCMLLHGGDILGYLLALSADKYGRNNVQASGFFVAGMCLLVCSMGERGSAIVLSAAVLGRLCVDVCFTTVYVGLAEIFSGKTSKIALTACETTARLGGIIAPLSGTWPTSVSCPLFAFLCLAAACCTMTLPEKAEVEDKGRQEKTITEEASTQAQISWI